MVRLIKKDRALFEHLVDVAQSNYTSGVVRTQQHDLVRAQLELTRLEDRLVMAQQQQEAALAELGEWLPNIAPQSISLSETLPKMKHEQPQEGPSSLSQTLLLHPKIKTIDQKTCDNTNRHRFGKAKTQTSVEIEHRIRLPRRRSCGSRPERLFFAGRKF